MEQGKRNWKENKTNQQQKPAAIAPFPFKIYKQIYVISGRH